MKDTTLYFREGGSDKQYRVWIEPAGNEFIVRAAWGRRAGPQQSAIKAGPCSLDWADQKYCRLLTEKMAKGYKPGEAAVPIAIAPRTTSPAFIRPMLLKPIGESEARILLFHESWICQPKFDGIRAQLHRNGPDVVCFSRTGKPVNLPVDVVEAFRAIAPQYGVVILDGELVDGRFVAFDVLCIGLDTREETLARRLELLDKYVPDSGPVRRTITARREVEKTLFSSQARALGLEGIVFKHLHSAYASERSDLAVKLKFVATASVRVSKQNAKRSVDIELADGTAVGSVTIPPNKQVPSVGDVIEVRYLYAHRDGCLIQAVFLKVRDDVQPDTAAQLQYKGEERQAS